MFYNAKPGPVTSFLTLVYPFEKQVWLFSILSFIFVFMASMLIKVKTNVATFRIFQIILSPLLSDSSAIKRQQNGSVHKNWYGYAVLFIWCMCGLLLSMSYTSNLLASLTVVRTEKTDDTFEVHDQPNLHLLSCYLYLVLV